METKRPPGEPGGRNARPFGAELSRYGGTPKAARIPPLSRKLAVWPRGISVLPVRIVVGGQSGCLMAYRITSAEGQTVCRRARKPASPSNNKLAMAAVPEPLGSPPGVAPAGERPRAWLAEGMPIAVTWIFPGSPDCHLPGRSAAPKIAFSTTEAEMKSRPSAGLCWQKVRQKQGNLW